MFFPKIYLFCQDKRLVYNGNCQLRIQVILNLSIINFYPKFIQFVLRQCPLVLQLLVLIRLIFFKLSCWQTGKLAHCADHAHGEETQCHIENYIFSRTWQTDWYSNNYYCHVYLSWYTWAGTYDSRCTLRGGPLEKWCGGGTFSTCTNIFFKFFACVDNFLKYNPLHEFFCFNL
jgi:hypothetical protein